MSTKITFKKDACKGCELCMVWCKKNLIAPDPDNLNKSGIHPMTVKSPEKCIACGNCAVMCPDAVITIEKFDE